MKTGLAAALRRVAAASAVLAVAAAGSASPAAARPDTEAAAGTVTANEAAAGTVTDAEAAEAVAAADTQANGYRLKLLAKAKPDECFAGIGKPYPPGPPCATGKPKVNQAYVWGLTRFRHSVWFGTGANPHCLTSGATLDYLKPTANDNYTCEYGESQIVKDNPEVPPEIGDVRSPEVWVYDTKSLKSTNKSPEINAKSPEDAERLRTTIGLRAAGYLDKVVLLAGPALNNSVNIFAFDALTQRFIGSTTLTEYGNIRTFLVADGELYLGVGIGRNGIAGGAVLRWAGDAAQPFTFVPVATLPVQAADLTNYDGRIAATSWPAEQPNTADRLGGVWISPKLADGAPGLNAEDATGWKQVWHSRKYEPDKVIAATYGMGGVAAYDGYLYWGTMHVPMKSSTVHATYYPPKNKLAAARQAKNTQRALSIFRGKNLGTPEQKIELVYGESKLPAWDPAANEGAGAWSMVSTNYTPLYGKSGFGHSFNNYTWRMAVTDGRLFVGTMDWSYLVQDLVPKGASEPGLNAAAKEAVSDVDNLRRVDPAAYGGDLWMFSSSDKAATAISTTGFGNYLNYGVRNMIVNSSGLYLGTANPMNLRTDPTDSVPEGGWELIKMTKKAG